MGGLSVNLWTDNTFHNVILLRCLLYIYYRYIIYNITFILFSIGLHIIQASVSPLLLSKHQRPTIPRAISNMSIYIHTQWCQTIEKGFDHTQCDHSTSKPIAITYLERSRSLIFMYWRSPVNTVMLLDTRVTPRPSNSVKLESIVGIVPYREHRRTFTNFPAPVTRILLLYYVLDWNSLRV